MGLKHKSIFCSRTWQMFGRPGCDSKNRDDLFQTDLSAVNFEQIALLHFFQSYGNFEITSLMALTFSEHVIRRCAPKEMLPRV